MSKRIPILVAVLAASGCGDASMSAADMSASGGARPGGSQDAGYFRAVLESGAVPTADDLTVEGFLAEHDLGLPDAECDQVLCLDALVGHDRAVAEESTATFVQLAITSSIDLSTRPRSPVNLAVVVDVSGSMAAEGKLEYVKQGLELLVNALTEADRFALVTYSTTAEVLVPSQPVASAAPLLEIIQALEPGGVTNLYDGMVLGYEQAEAGMEGFLLSRVMLLSDGLANEGVVDNELILATSRDFNDLGIGLTTVGVGLEFNQELMRCLSEQGGGNFYFIQNAEKITEVFRDELDFLVTPLANDLLVSISFADGFTLGETYGLSYEIDELGRAVVRVPTVFASRSGGATLLRIDLTDAIDGLAGRVVTEIAYSYRPIGGDGTVLDEVSSITDARVPAVDESGRGYDAPVVLKSLVLWNMVESFKKAADIYGGPYDNQAALDEIERLAAYVDEANALLEDEEIARDREELIARFATNLGGDLSTDSTEYMDDHYRYYGDDNGSLFPGLFFCGCTGTPGEGLLAALFACAISLLRRPRRIRTRA